MKARAFNTVNVNYESNAVIKSSENKSKLKDEIYYYLNVPPQIKHYFPQLLAYEDNFSSYSLEYIPYKNLGELFLGDNLTLKEAKKIILQLMSILNELHSCTISLTHEQLKNFNEFYLKKTLQRIEELKKIPFFSSLLKENYIYINQQRYKNFSLMEEQFRTYMAAYVQQIAAFSIIHGDYCFSNILYSPLRSSIKLIDPRGSFGVRSIYGDPNYDYAKLLHCLNGKYDLIINNHYDLSGHNNQFLFQLKESRLLDDCCDFYFEQLAVSKINLECLLVLEASLFLSMACLHYEDEQRQKALYLRGIILLNQALKN